MQEVLRGMRMRTIKVKKDDLLTKLRANLEKHKADYETACAGYRAKAIIALRAKVRELQGGETAALYFGDVDKPESHANSYEVVIGMLEMSIETEVELNTEEYQCWVMDQWGWRKGFAETITKYISSK